MRYIDEKVIDAKKNTEILEELIKEYEHFMLSCAAKTSGHYIDKSDDEWSVALLAFYEAVQSYEIDKADSDLCQDADRSRLMIISELK